MDAMSLETAAERYGRAIQHAHNLVAVHRAAGSGGRGRRVREVSVNRAVVVVTVATWQATVQDLATVLRGAEPDPSDPHAAVHRLLRGDLAKAIGDFATPSPENSRTLLQRAGLDPWPHWTWTQSRGAKGNEVMAAHQVAAVMREWVKIRHAIAHGHETLPNYEVLEAVREATAKGKADDNPSLRLKDAEQCISFFHRVTVLTGNAVAAFVGVPERGWLPID